MKKLLFIILAVILMSSVSFAGVVMFGIKGGGDGNRPATLKEYQDTYGGDLTKVPLYLGFELGYEMDLTGHYDQEIGSAIKLGFKLGVDLYGPNELKDSPIVIDHKEDTSAFPLSVYLKYDDTVSFYVGGGISYFGTTLTIGSTERHDGRFTPHLMSGIEVRCSPSLGIGLDFQYNFNAKVEKSGTVYSDRSGLQGALAARFYF